MVQEPEALDRESAGKSVQIVEPPKEPVAPVKGILRKPTEKFPEDPEPIREGVAPHKDALKGKDIPVGARWTRIDRRLVNPEALEQAKERFEERMDCVIVLRVLTKEEIQKLADRTKKIRESRGTLIPHVVPYPVLTRLQKKSTIMSAAIAMTVTGEVTVPRTIEMTKSVTATETVATTTGSDAAATTMKATTTTASENESVNAIGLGKSRSTMEGDYNE
jgi:hypothetical protein